MANRARGGNGGAAAGFSDEPGGGGGGLGGDAFLSAGGGVGLQAVGGGNPGVVRGAAGGGASGATNPGGPGGAWGGGGGVGGGTGVMGDMIVGSGGGGGGVGGGSGVARVIVGTIIVDGNPITLYSGGQGGSGGFGGGGGGSEGRDIQAGHGGFGAGGGGGGYSGNAGFGGYGAGGGGHGKPDSQMGLYGQGGWGGGNGGLAYSDPVFGTGLGGGGGGGAALGGGIFVAEGGRLILGSGSIAGNLVTGGTGGAGSIFGFPYAGQSGVAFGTGIFIQGSGSATFAPAVGTTQIIADVISDEYGTGHPDNASQSASIEMQGLGTVVLAAANVYSGRTTVRSGVLASGANFSLADGFGDDLGVFVEGGTLRSGHNQRVASLAVNAGGTASLTGGTFTSLAGASVAGGGVLAFNGTSGGIFSGGVASNGAITAGNGVNASTSTITGGVTGTGSVVVGSPGGSAGATLRLGAAANTAGIVTINASSTLAFTGGAGSRLRVSGDYLNVNSGSGNSFNPTAGVTGGAIDAAGTGPFQAITGAKISNGASTTPTLALGNVHVGDSASFAIRNTGTNGPALRGAVQTTGLSGGVLTGLSDGNVAPVASGASSADYTLTVARAGVISGQSVGIVSNFANVPTQTITIGGTAYAYAAPQYRKLGGDGIFYRLISTYTLDFGTVAPGSNVGASLELFNALVGGAASAYTDLLSGAFSQTAGPFNLSGFTNFSGIAGGNTAAAMTVGFSSDKEGLYQQVVTLTGSSDNVAGLGSTPRPLALRLVANVIAIPEPSTWALVAAGFTGLGFAARHSRRRPPTTVADRRNRP